LPTKTGEIAVTIIYEHIAIIALVEIKPCPFAIYVYSACRNKNDEK